jgi:hypothetical protein
MWVVHDALLTSWLLCFLVTNQTPLHGQRLDVGCSSLLDVPSYMLSSLSHSQFCFFLIISSHKKLKLKFVQLNKKVML